MTNLSNNNFFKSPLAIRQLIYIMIISALATLIVSSIQLYIEYKNDINNLNNQLNHIKNTHLESLTDSLWKVDTSHIMLQLNSILSLQDITFIEIEENDNTIYSVGHLNKNSTIIKKSFPMIYNYYGKQRQIGSLNVNATLSRIYSRLIDRIFIVIISQAVKTFTTSFFILIIIYQLVIKNLIRISDYSKKISLKDLDKNLEPLKNLFYKPKNDEITELCDSLNNMRIRLKNEVFERNKSEKKLKENEENLRITLNSITDGVITTDLDGHILTMNPVAEKITGWELNTASGLDLEKVFSIYDLKKRNKLINPVNVALKHGKVSDLSSNTILISKFGNEHIISYTAAPLKDDNLNIRGVVLVFKDITSQYNKDKKLYEKEKMYRLIFEESGASIMIADPYTYKFEDFNKKSCEMLGYNDVELLNLTIPDIIDESIDHNIFLKHIKKIIEKKEDSFESTLVKKSGNKLNCLVTTRVIKIDNFEKIHAVIHDITELRNIQAKLIESQKMDSIGNLAGGIAHDFNNMLGVILGYSTLLISEEEDLEKRAIIQGIIESSERAGELTQKLLGFGKRGKNIITSVNLNNSVDDVYSILKRSVDKGKNIKFEVFMESELHSIDGDPVQIKQVIMNLCLNAIDAIESNGNITIETKNINFENKFSSENIELLDNCVELSVKDNGCGIKRDVGSKVFEPFYTTKKEGKIKGSGLGLATVYGIVKNHGGIIEYNSVEDKGSVFRVIFPKGIKQKPDNEKTKNMNDESKGTILIVEDEEILSSMLEKILNRLGFEVLKAFNGEEGVEVFRQNNNKISAVILDMRMPVMNGREAFIEMKKIDQNVKALLSTGYGSNEEAQEIIDMGAKGLLSKPYHMKELSLKINELAF